MACYNDVDEAACPEKLAGFARAHGPMPAYIGSVGMFKDTRTIFAAPVMNEGMYCFHRRLHECLQGFDTGGWEWYCPGRWVVHCTLALIKDDEDAVFYKASELILREFEKMSGSFVSIGLVKISFPVEEIFTAVLNGCETAPDSRFA